MIERNKQSNFSIKISGEFMRYLYVLIIFCLVSVDLLAEINKDISYYFDKSEIDFVRKDKNDLYPESEVYMYINQQKNVYILSSLNKYPFGIMEIGDSDVYIDLNGDGKIDNKFHSVNIPYWIIKKNSTSLGKTKNVIASLDNYYEIYKSNEGNHHFNTISIEFNDALKDINYDNRDLYYLIYLNSVSSTGNQEWCIYALKNLDTEINSRFNYNATHIVIYIYLIETLVKQKKFDTAETCLNYALEKDPQNPVLKFYQYKLELNPTKAEILHDELLRNYKNHWLVRQIK